jgi:hypothetical protein
MLLTDENPENRKETILAGSHLERPNLPDPLRPRPIEPLPSPLRPGQYIGPREEELGRILKEILDKLTAIENRLKTIEEQLKTRH